MDLTNIKQRFDIIGNNPALDHALEIAVQVAPTDLSVLVLGESGVGKEVIPQIIHQNSARKHNDYIAVNCGAIPEGTIDSELFGHEKGSFTGATEMRKGYFEVVNGGTIFLDEVADLPLATQVRLLRVIQSGEFMRVGSSQVMKTDVRVIAATNVNLISAINNGRFREDLYYRLNTVPIHIPPLRERPEDINLLFKKFALDFADKYHMPAVRLTPEARVILESYKWPGNVRQLKSVAEQISILERERTITPEILRNYIPKEEIHALPARTNDTANYDYPADRDIIFKILYQLRKEVDSLKATISSLKTPEIKPGEEAHTTAIQPAAHYLLTPDGVTEDEEELMHDVGEVVPETEEQVPVAQKEPKTIRDVNLELIKKTLEKHGGKRKAAAEELGISERTLYRKIKELSGNS
ncbi:MAG: sigma-54 dependent transcriptional regulator [Bacteroidales bacterium]|jgi:transcriptional regulator with PAS, ATPase and Fis domain|nr:sigma-54 dependent transcriptional regulator [Bacteroidales bacterium]MCI2121187.1 sigma-54 dependent transcriptional regulator [Bacteroidales bacterium]MCI2145025.1 sigma-54 dependent transcriptional regulator [Bacteroidales bacterium]